MTHALQNSYLTTNFMENEYFIQISKQSLFQKDFSGGMGGLQVLMAIKNPLEKFVPCILVGIIN